MIKAVAVHISISVLIVYGYGCYNDQFPLKYGRCKVIILIIIIILTKVINKKKKNILLILKTKGEGWSTAN